MRVTCLCGLLILLLSSAGPAVAAPDEGLVEAVRSGDYAAARALVEAGAAVDTPQADGTTALHWAVRGGRADIASLLLRAGADANAANRYGVTPLSLACTNGSAGIVGRLLDAGADPNLATPEGETPLMTAARTGDPEVLHLLLTHGADVHTAEAWRGQTALMWAAGEGNAAAAGVLLEAGADVAVRSSRGMTALLFAARSGDMDTVRALLDGGANIDESAMDAIPRGGAEDGNEDLPPRLGSSVLATAIENAHYDLAAWLVAEGADLNADGPRGTALHGLVRTRNCERTALPCPVRSGPLDSMELAELLLAHGADVDARMSADPPKNGTYDYTYMSHVGATPLFLAVKASDTAMTGLLLDHGADPAIGNDESTTPLLVAAGIGYIEGQILASEEKAFEAVRMLVEHGEDVNTTNARNETALHGAAYRGANSIALYLIDRGARLDIADELGRMPVTIADGVVAGPYFRAHDETAALLRERMGASAPPRPTSQGAR